VSVAAARTLARRLLDRCGETLDPAPTAGLDRVFPDAQTLAEASLDGLGLTGPRAATIHAIARAVVDGRIDFRAEHTLDAFVQRWTALPGIGAWTANYIALRALSHPDAFPADDLILRRAISPGAMPLSARALAARAEAWRPWRGYAVMHLWRSTSDKD
jgi:AraC family transcriptional regulator of adaptative response / DNA-3-methyladenine glycosylase II